MQTNVLFALRLCEEQFEIPGVMYQSNWSFNILPLGIWTFEVWLVQIPSPRRKKAIQMPHQIISTEVPLLRDKFLLQSNTAPLFRERDAEKTPSILLLKTILKELFTNKGEILSCRSVKPCKTWKNPQEYYARTRDKSGSNSPPFQGNVQIPPFTGTMHSQMPGVCPGSGCWKLQFDRYINQANVI